MLATREYVDKQVALEADFRRTHMKYSDENTRRLEDKLEALAKYLGVVIAKSPEHYEVITCNETK